MSVVYKCRELIQAFVAYYYPGAYVVMRETGECRVWIADRLSNPKEKGRIRYGS